MFSIRKATTADSGFVLSLYRSLVGTGHCTWSLYYPALEDVDADIASASLYVLCDDGVIIGAGAAGNDVELNGLSCWSTGIKNPCALSRIGISLSYQHRGLAGKLLSYIESDAAVRGFDGMHFLVSKTNPEALRLYTSHGFNAVGETQMFDLDWYCYEKSFILKNG